MKKAKKTLSLALTLSLTAALFVGGSCLAEESEADAAPDGYPEKEISGIIQWGEGGGTDTILRPLANLAESPLGGTIEVENMAGDAGAIATEYVYEQPADGYTLLLGAENPALYEALGLSDVTYENFVPIIVVGDETCGIVVGKDEDGNPAYTNLTDLVNDALAAPGTITMSSNGVGSLAWEGGTMLTNVTGAEFDEVDEYNSDLEAMNAVINGECDFTFCKVQTGLDAHNLQELTFISMLSTEPVTNLEGIALITDDYPEFSEYLPWGPFYGVFVKEGTDDEAIDALTDAMTVAYEDAAYQDILDSLDINPLGLTGSDAEEYVESWQEKTVKALEGGSGEE